MEEVSFLKVPISLMYNVVMFCNWKVLCRVLIWFTGDMVQKEKSYSGTVDSIFSFSFLFSAVVAKLLS